MHETFSLTTDMWQISPRQASRSLNYAHTCVIKMHSLPIYGGSGILCSLFARYRLTFLFYIYFGGNIFWCENIYRSFMLIIISNCFFSPTGITYREWAPGAKVRFASFVILRFYFLLLVTLYVRITYYGQV